MPKDLTPDPALTLDAVLKENADLKAQLAKLKAQKEFDDATEALIAKKTAVGLTRAQAIAVGGVGPAGKEVEHPDARHEHHEDAGEDEQDQREQ